MAHFAVTDVDGKRFHYAERFSRAALGLAGAGGSPLAVRLEDWSALETAADAMDHAACRPGRRRGGGPDRSGASQPVVLNGEAGLEPQGERTGQRLLLLFHTAHGDVRHHPDRHGDLQRRGTLLARPGVEHERPGGDQVGWDWFALQLDDGRDLMFYRLRRSDGSADPFSSGTLVAADGSSRHLAREEVQLASRRTGGQARPSGSRYPSRWRLRVPAEGLDLEIVPRLADQELLASVRYWEGAVAVRGISAGSPGGSGYLEMTGYGATDKKASDHRP